MDLKPGDLVFLTQEYENYVFSHNPKLSISLVNRLAKLESIIDWDSPSGKKIKELREKSGKWKDLPLEDNKYIFSIYYHDLEGRKKQKLVVEKTPMFGKDPKTGAPFFIKVPCELFKEITKKCESFEVQDK
jgi:hypothetical protein